MISKKIAALALTLLLNACSRTDVVPAGSKVYKHPAGLSCFLPKDWVEPLPEPRGIALVNQDSTSGGFSGISIFYHESEPPQKEPVMEFIAGKRLIYPELRLENASLAGHPAWKLGIKRDLRLHHNRAPVQVNEEIWAVPASNGFYEIAFTAPVYLPSTGRRVFDDVLASMKIKG